MPEKKFARYAMFGSLYFTQGTILSYFTALNALYFLSRGLSMTSVGIFASIAMIPFVIKVFLGMLSDKVNLLGLGHRKPYILLGLTVQVVCLIIVPFIDPAKYYWGFVAIAFVLQMGMALYDTCTDGLALDTIPEDEQGTIQTFMVGGRALGVVVTASVVGLLAQNVSWAAVFWLLAVFTLVPIPMVLRVKEAARPVERSFDWKAFAAFKQKTIIALAALGFVFFLIIAGANQIVNPYLQERFNISLSQAGYLTTVWGIGVVLGSVIGGQLIQRVGRKRATWISIAVSVIGILPLAFIPAAWWAWLLVGLFGLSYGTYQTIYFALAMGYTDSRIAASMFSILMAVTNVAQGVGMALSGFLADSAMGYTGVFILLALLNVIAIPIMPLIFGKRETVEA
ncbi:MAG: MFS transporter [Anaerolineaceae bacterium]|nr:MFS transporter [Anaerolineaceae bacterium]